MVQAVLSHDHAAIMSATLKKKRGGGESPWTLTTRPSQGAYSQFYKAMFIGSTTGKLDQKLKGLSVLAKNPT